MGTHRLVQVESSGLLYDQAGFDYYSMGEKDVDGLDHAILLPEVGTDASNRIYFNNPNSNAHWIGVHNCGTTPVTEVISILCTSLVGDDFAKDGDASDYNDDTNYLEIPPGDIVYGAFDQVYMDNTSEYIIAYIGK
jgi:hypothetical protein